MTTGQQASLFSGAHRTPAGAVVMASDGDVITGLWFEGQRHFMSGIGETSEANLPVFEQTRDWLDAYFEGSRQSPPPYALPQSTWFRESVWHILEEIPYGTTTTYGDIASELSRRYGRPVSARAVGGAVGRNPISVIVPCHRVVGADGRMTGYAGGLDRKRTLLSVEGIRVDGDRIIP